MSLADKLLREGYVLLDMGHALLALRPGSAPLCLAVPYDWPMVMIRRGARRAASTWRPRERSRVLVRRASDLAGLGEAVINPDLTVESLDLPIGEWALADLHTPLGLRPWEAMESLVLSLRPTAVVLLASFTDPYSLRVVSDELPGFVLVHQECGIQPPWKLWRGPRVPVKYSDDPLPCSSPASGELERALQALMALKGRGC